MGCYMLSRESLVNSEMLYSEQGEPGNCGLLLHAEQGKPGKQ